jgi:methionyl aminopeptidase
MQILRSTREIEQMRKAGLVVWEAHQLVAAMLRPGVTTRDLDAAVDRLFQQRGAIPLFKGYTPDGASVPFPAATCISINDVVVHGIPSDRKLVEGDIVSIDTGCKLNGWCGDAAVTHPVGHIESDVQRLLAVTSGVLDLAIELMGERTRWSQVAREMETYVKDNKFSVVEAFVGHGIGREMHEDPQVPNFAGRNFRRSGDFALEPGLVIAVEPMVNLGSKQVREQPDQWTQCTADGRPSAHFEHTVALTDSGPRVLTEGPSGNKL